jgi:hypothetical protein
MKIFASLFVLLSLSAFAQERCTWGQEQATLNKAIKICNEKLADFENETGTTCKPTHQHMSVCWANCFNSTGERFAKVRVDMYSACEWEYVEYARTVVRYY